MIERHRKLLVWQKAMDLTVAVYDYTKHLPESERFGLIGQMRRCSVSIPSNISEGAARHSDKEFLRFLNIAKGSLAELDTQQELCRRLYGLNWKENEIDVLFLEVFSLNEALRNTLIRSK